MLKELEKILNTTLQGEIITHVRLISRKNAPGEVETIDTIVIDTPFCSTKFFVSGVSDLSIESRANMRDFK